jgi:xanthine/CO dehydrogenase XdhC/CoxF family maturation factor
MKERERILELWDAAQHAGEAAVLATVVKTQGSSYRLPGARLLLTKSGQRAGSVSGGCLEAELLKKAWWLTENGPVVRRYDTTPEGEISEGGFGLGCNGVIHVLLERLATGNAPVLELIRGVHLHRRPAVVTHPTGWEETLNPPPRLLICGAGDDAVPLAELAKYLGWQVFISDGRAHYARRDKFPQADEVSVRVGPSVSIDPWTVAVIMSHSYSQDLDVLRELSSQPLRYLGILGPHKRTVQLLADSGLDLACLEAHLHSPMGLDLGADGPEQVALAVIAEIQAALNGREGGSLRQRDGSIHGHESPWVQSIVCA